MTNLPENLRHAPRGNRRFLNWVSDLLMYVDSLAAHVPELVNSSEINSDGLDPVLAEVLEKALAEWMEIHGTKRGVTVRDFGGLDDDLVSKLAAKLSVASKRLKKPNFPGSSAKRVRMAAIGADGIPIDQILTILEHAVRSEWLVHQSLMTASVRAANVLSCP